MGVEDASVIVSAESVREADSIDAVEDSISVEDAWVTIWVDSIGKTDPRDAVSTGTDWGETDPTEAD